MESTVGGRRSTNYDLACTYSAKLDHKFEPTPPSDREQLVTASGNRVVATPYLVQFDKGTQLKASKPSTGRLFDTHTFGGGAWEEELELTYSVFPPANLLQGASSSYMKGDASLASQATTQAMANARRGAVGLPMLLKEMPASLAMIGKRSTDVLNAGTKIQETWVDRYRKARTKRGRARVAVDAASAHLEFMFGWTPFISETYELMKALQTEKRVDVVGRGRAKKKRVTPLPSSISPQDNLTGESVCNGNWSRWYAYLSGHHVRTGAYTEEWKYRSSIRWAFDARWSGDASKYGANPVDALFDGFPLSFLLNFSTNVQDFLVANSPVIGGKFVTGHVSMLAESCTTLDIHSSLQAHSFFPGSKQIALDPGKVTVESAKVVMERTPFLTEPDAEFALRSILDLGRAASLASLGVVAAESRFRTALSKRQFKLPKFRNPSKKPGYLPPIDYTP